MKKVEKILGESGIKSEEKISVLIKMSLTQKCSVSKKMEKWPLIRVTLNTLVPLAKVVSAEL